MTNTNVQEIPISTVQSSTAASYVIPANRYAIVRAQVGNGGTFSINGTVVMNSDSWSTIASNVSPKAITMGSGHRAMSTPIQVGGATIPGTVSNHFQNNTSTTATTFADAGDIFTNGAAKTRDSATFKVIAGTTIVGSGDSRYHVELYKIAGAAT